MFCSCYQGINTDGEKERHQIMVSLKPFKGTRPFNEEAINIIAPSTDHLSEENIDLISNKNYWNYLKVLNPVGQLSVILKFSLSLFKKSVSERPFKSLITLL